MKEKDPLPLGGVISAILRSGELGKKFAQEQIKEEWAKLSNGNIAKYTSSVNVRERKLFVKLTSPLLKNDLMMQRSELAKRLNEKVGVEVIDEIVFL